MQAVAPVFVRNHDVAVDAGKTGGNAGVERHCLGRIRIEEHRNLVGGHFLDGTDDPVPERLNE